MSVPFGEEVIRNPFFLRRYKSREKSLRAEDFSARIEEPEAALSYQLVQHAKMLVGGHLALAGVLISHGQLL